MLRNAVFVCVLALFAAFAAAGSNPEVPPVPPVIQAKDEEVKKVLEEFDKAVSEKSAENQGKALGEMESLRHDSFIPAIRTGLKSAESGVLAAAIRAAATHGLKDFEKDARKLLHAKPTKKETSGMAGEVGAACIDYLVRLDFAGEEETVLESHLRELYSSAVTDDRRVGAPWARDLVRASVHYLGKAKYKLAVPTLVEMVGEPQPKPIPPGKPDTNPPPIYWKSRVKLWQASESWVRWALKEITGQSFASPREWEAWLKQNKKDFK